jgi:bifunctional DNase/RNase
MRIIPCMMLAALWCGPCNEIAESLEKEMVREEKAEVSKGTEAEGEVEMEIAMNIPQVSGSFAVVLKEKDGDRYMPIFIGPNEGMAIQRGIDRERMSRPMTHDLLASAISSMGGKVDRLVVSDLHHGTFYGTLYIEQDDEMVELDCRPSDGMALASTVLAPIRVDEKVLDVAAMTTEQMKKEGFIVDQPSI